MWWRKLRAQFPEPSGDERQRSSGASTPHGANAVGTNLTMNGEPAFQLTVTDVLDLHSFAPKDVKAALETYLEEAWVKGFSSVRIVHGKGIGVQRELVRSILRRTAFIASYRDAPAEAGGWGATLAWFRTAEPSRQSNQLG
jgi:hypothetical protein